MIIFIYWLEDIETGEERHLANETFYDVGSIVEFGGRTYKVVDYAVDPVIGCDELVDPREE